MLRVREGCLRVRGVLALGGGRAFSADSSSEPVVRDRWKCLTANPSEWYPIARALRRKVIYHAGPTNSGKTHSSLVAFRNAPSGVYSAPLRLLAMEVYEATNMDGTLCSLITGQEKKRVPGAQVGVWI